MIGIQVFFSFIKKGTHETMSSDESNKLLINKNQIMPIYIIEREVPGVEKLKGRDRQAAAQKSVRALRDIGPEIQWVHSYVSNDKTHCVYVSDNEDLIIDHAKRSGFPANKITKIEYLLNPVDAEG